MFLFKKIKLICSIALTANVQQINTNHAMLMQTSGTKVGQQMVPHCLEMLAVETFKVSKHCATQLDCFECSVHWATQLDCLVSSKQCITWLSSWAQSTGQPG
jgi:hypothetical protein